MTNERVMLPYFHSARLFFDDEGDAGLASAVVLGYSGRGDTDPDIVVIESLLQQSVWQNGEQELFLQAGGQAPVSFAHATGERELLSASFKSGSRRLACRWAIVAKTVPFGFYGLRLQWSLQECQLLRCSHCWCGSGQVQLCRQAC